MIAILIILKSSGARPDPGNREGVHMAVPSRIKERLAGGLKRLIPILNQQKTRDVSEADTVTLVKDLLSEVLGYDKYADLTSEFAIRGTYCDLVVKIDDKVSQVVEVKAIGVELDDRHVKQAIDYAANQGVEWVILTNGMIWRLYRVVFAKPIDKKLVAQIDLCSIDLRQESNIEALYLFTKEGVKKGAHIELHARQEATSRFLLAALIVSNESVLSAIRRELRRVVDVIVTDEEIVDVLKSEVIKRDSLEGPNAESALRRVTKKEVRPLRTAKATATETGPPDERGELSQPESSSSSEPEA